jgi:hypothetical protein
VLLAPSHPRLPQFIERQENRLRCGEAIRATSVTRGACEQLRNLHLKAAGAFTIVLDCSPPLTRSDPHPQPGDRGGPVAGTRTTAARPQLDPVDARRSSNYIGHDF